MFSSDCPVASPSGIDCVIQVSSWMLTALSLSPDTVSLTLPFSWHSAQTTLPVSRRGLAKSSDYASRFEHCLLAGLSWSQAQSWWRLGYEHSLKMLQKIWRRLQKTWNLGSSPIPERRLKAFLRILTTLQWLCSPSWRPSLSTSLSISLEWTYSVSSTGICRGCMCTWPQLGGAGPIHLHWPWGQSRERIIPCLFFLRLKKKKKKK